MGLIEIYLIGVAATLLFLILRGATCITWMLAWALLWPILWPLTGLLCAIAWAVYGRVEGK